MRNNISDARTMEGLDGVSNWKEAKRPNKTESTPTNAAIRAICSGVRLRRRAAAAGMLSSQVTRSTPTIFIARAITAAMISISISS